MNLHTDLTYIYLLSSHLKNFKQKKVDLFTFSHECEDFSRGKPKQRGYIYSRNGEFNVHCHHCGMSHRFSTFLRQVSPTLYADYRLHRYKQGADGDKPVIRVERKEESRTVELRDDVLDALERVDALSESHPVRRILSRRMIPEAQLSRLYFAKHFFEYISKYDERFLNRSDEHPRLVIPYYNAHGRVFAFTSRSFGDEKPKYIHTRLTEVDELIYGLETIDARRKIVVVEGQIDSLFLDNCIAVGGASYDCAFLKSIQSNAVIVPDNDFRRNKHVYAQVKKVIDRGYTVSLLPEEFPKDINECIQAGISAETLNRYIHSTQYSGSAALLELAANKRFA